MILTSWDIQADSLRLEDVEIFLIAIVALSKKSDPQYYETLVKNAKQHPDSWNNVFRVALNKGIMETTSIH